MRLGAADPYWKVRTAAMTTLQVLASRRDKRVALACRARLKDGDFNVYGILQKSTDTRHDVRRAHRLYMFVNAAGHSSDNFLAFCFVNILLE